MRPKHPIIGLAGGIGAGKSRVAAEFERLGCLVIDSDRLNRQVLRRAEIGRTLQSWWGNDVIDESGRPDTRKIAEIITDPQQRKRLESLVHPLIAEQRQAMIRRAETDSTVKAIILDSPLLFESDLDRVCDAIVFVDVQPATRLERLKQQRGWSVDEVRRREAWQLSPVKKRSRADFVVSNEGAAEDLRPQVRKILETTVRTHTPKA